MVALSWRSPAGSDRRWLSRVLPLLVLLVLAALIALPSLSAFAGQAASGELFYYPCSSCHPVTMVPGTERPTRLLPNDFTGHKIVLVGHDKLGEDDVACLTCHDDPSRDPGKLKIAGGKLIDIKGDVSQVCYRCHSTQYKLWKAGDHGKGKPKCTAAGCHDPHTPGWIYAQPLQPFIGSGFQFRVLSQREAFSPLAPPAPAPAVDTPPWFRVIVVLGLVALGVQIVRLVLGRRKQ
ncbi:MAG: hypothetical protein LLG08_02540 [Actinomycetia bacterium]|nr:hypothetical protein [Actinomycetes bacterium]